MTIPRNLGNFADNLNTSGQAALTGISPSGSTAGQVITSAGSSATPIWATPNAGAIVLISTATASNSTSVSFTGLTTAYAYYIFEFDSVFGAAAGYSFKIFASTNNGVSYLGSSAYRYSTFYARSNSTSGIQADSTGNEIQIAAVNAGMGADSSNSVSGTLHFFAPNSVSNNFVFDSVSKNGVALERNAGAATLVTSAAINAIQFFASVNITGNFRLYGVVKT